MAIQMLRLLSFNACIALMFANSGFSALTERVRIASDIAAIDSLLMDLAEYVDINCGSPPGVRNSTELLQDGWVKRDLGQGRFSWAFELAEGSRSYLLLSQPEDGLSGSLRLKFQAVSHPQLIGTWRISRMSRSPAHVPGLAASVASESEGVEKTCPLPYSL